MNLRDWFHAKRGPSEEKCDATFALRSFGLPFLPTQKWQLVESRSMRLEHFGRFGTLEEDVV